MNDERISASNIVHLKKHKPPLGGAFVRDIREAHAAVLLIGLSNTNQYEPISRTIDNISQ